MKYGIILLLIFSGIAPAYGYNSSGHSSDYKNYYQTAYYPDDYYARIPYPEPYYSDPNYPAAGNAVQNQYAPAYYQAPQYPACLNQAYSYQAQPYQAYQYQNQAVHNPSYPPAYAYPNYYQPPYPEQNQNKTLQQPEVNLNAIKNSKRQSMQKKISTQKQSARTENPTQNLRQKTASQLTSKKQFLYQILPLIISANKSIQYDRKQLLDISSKGNASMTNKDKSQLKKLAKRYRVSGDIIHDISLQQELLKRVDEIIPSMALAQAANESAWGTSRFSKQGNNLFGIWTYNPEIGIKPLKREPGKKHFVRKFKSFQESVTIYMHTLNTHSAYKKLRDIRYEAALNDRKLSGYELAKGLEKYSARGLEYIQMIQGMINKNNLENIALSELALNKA